MDFLRRHLFYIISVVVAASGLALGALGFQGMPKVRSEIESVGRVYNELNGIASSPRLDRIRAEEIKIQKIKEDRDAVFKAAGSLYGYEPLVQNVFPNGSNADRLRFRRAYAEAMNELFRTLKSGTPATSVEVKLWSDMIANERAEMIARGESPDQVTEALYTPAGVLTLAGAKRDAQARAHLAAAQKIRCYAVHFADDKPPAQHSSLQFAESMKGSGAADTLYPEDVWWAQIGYWIQKDVVEAIAAVNDEAAAEASKAGEEAAVGVMPVKDVISIRYYDRYIPRDGEVYVGDPPGGELPARPVGTPETVFTHSGSTDWFEVVQFSVKLVMDQRDIPKFVDRLCKNRFHTLLRVAYVAVPPNRRMLGKIYGSGPTVNVVFDFETTMLGEVFRRWMPPEVCEFNGITCPEP